MRRLTVLALTALVAGCTASNPQLTPTQAGTASPHAESTTEASGEPMVIRLRLDIADMEGADIVATGEVLEGSSLGDEPFCVEGTAEDRHADEDPAMEPYGLLHRTLTCPDGTVRVGFIPDIAPIGQPQGGSWTIVSGTGAFVGLKGSGEMENVPDPADDSLALETLTGTVSR